MGHRSQSEYDAKDGRFSDRSLIILDGLGVGLVLSSLLLGKLIDIILRVNMADLTYSCPKFS